MTIKEIARNLACRDCDICKGEPQPCGGGQYQMYVNCLKIAEEQHRIDREEFTAKLKNACLTVETKYDMNTFGFLYDRILQAMKGEDYD